MSKKPDKKKGVFSVWDAKPAETEKDKKYEMFTDDHGNSTTGTLRPVRGKGDTDALRDLFGKQQAAGDKAQGNLDKAVVLWSNGYQIGENGQFQSTADSPQNQQFVEDLKQGVVPKALEPMLAEQLGADAASMGVNIIDKSKEEYEAPPPPKFTAFQGSGQALGGGSPDSAVNVKLGDVAPREIAVDDKSETIIVQIILFDRKVIKQKLNAKHTVLQLFAHVKAVSGYNGAFDLLAGFPPKPLTDASQTVKAAGLAGARVTQKKK